MNTNASSYELARANFRDACTPDQIDSLNTEWSSSISFMISM